MKRPALIIALILSISGSLTARAEEDKPAMIPAEEITSASATIFRMANNRFDGLVQKHSALLDLTPKLMACKTVFPGRAIDSKSIYRISDVELMQSEFSDSAIFILRSKELVMADRFQKQIRTLAGTNIVLMYTGYIKGAYEAYSKIIELDPELGQTICENAWADLQPYIEMPNE